MVWSREDHGWKIYWTMAGSREDHGWIMAGKLTGPWLDHVRIMAGKWTGPWLDNLLDHGWITRGSWLDHVQILAGKLTGPWLDHQRFWLSRQKYLAKEEERTLLWIWMGPWSGSRRPRVEPGKPQTGIRKSPERKKCNLEIQEFIRDTTCDHHSWHYHFNEISTCDSLTSPQETAYNKEIRFEKQNKSQLQTQKPQWRACYSHHVYKSKAVTTTPKIWKLLSLKTTRNPTTLLKIILHRTYIRQ